jgi:LysM repeat protein
MRVRTKSACVVLAWGILLLLAAAGSSGSPRPAQANNRIATSTTSNISTARTIIHATLTNAQTSTLTSSPAARPDAARSGLAAPRATRSGGGYVVQPGDTLSGIAAALGIRGGWPALYAANRHAIGPNPDVIQAGTALALPGPTAPARYTIAAGDTLTGVAAALGIRGGWPALYAANRHAIGPNPDVIRAGVVVTIPRSASAPASVSRPPHPARRPSPPPATAPAPARTPATAPARSPASANASAKASAKPSAKPSAKAKSTVSAKAPTAGGLPRWLQIVLLAAGILIGAAFLAEPALAIARRRRNARQNARQNAVKATGPAACPTAERRIVLADYDRLVVTSSGPDGTVCVLRPPGADPEVILLAARLVLAQDRYEELAGCLGVAERSRRSRE